MHNALNIFRAHRRELKKKLYANKPEVEPYKNYAPTEDSETVTRTDGKLVVETSSGGTDTNPYQVINTDCSGEILMGDTPNNCPSNSSATAALVHHVESPILTPTANRKRQLNVKWSIPNTGPTEILSPKRSRHNFAVITKQKPFEWQPVDAEEWHVYTEVIHSNLSPSSISKVEPISKSAEAANDSSIQPVHSVVSHQVTEDIDCAETSNQMESANSSEIIDSSETIEASELIDTFEPVQLSEPIDTLNPTDTTEHIDTLNLTDITEPIDTLNVTDICQPIDIINPTDICEPIQSIEQDNFPELMSASEVDQLLQPSTSRAPTCTPESTNPCNGDEALPPTNAPSPPANPESHNTTTASTAPLTYSATFLRCAIRRNAFQRLTLALYESRAMPRAYALHARLTATGAAPTERRLWPRGEDADVVGQDALRAAKHVWCAAWRRFTGRPWGRGDAEDGEEREVQGEVWTGLPSAEDCAEWPFVDWQDGAAGACAPVARVLTIVS